MTFLSGFTLRKAIKYGSTRPSSSLSAFPLLIAKTSDTDVGAELTTRKMAVTLSDGTTQVPYGSHYFNSVGGSADYTIRAKFDLSSSASQGDILGYLYYDNTATDQQNRSGCVSGFTGFWPLEEDPSGSAPQMLDWTGNYNGTSHGMASGDLVSGQVAHGLNFDSNSKYVSTGLVLSQSDQQEMTAGCWIKPSLTNTTGAFLANRQSDTGGFFELIQRPGGIQLEILNSSGTLFATSPAYVPTAGQWYMIDGTVSISGGAANLYVNGSLAATVSISGSLQSASHVDIATIFSGLFGFTGLIDEVTLATSVRSAPWIAFNYANQFSNSATVTLGDEEVAGRLVNSLRGQAGLNGYLAGLVGLRKAFSGSCGLREYNSGEAGER